MRRCIALFVIILLFLSLVTACNINNDGTEDKSGLDKGLNNNKTTEEDSKEDSKEDSSEDSKEESTNNDDNNKDTNDKKRQYNKENDFTLKDLNGDEVSLSDFQGKIVILNFFATWCPPCKAEMPDFESINKKYEDVVVLAVNPTVVELRGGTDSKKAEAKVRSFIDESNYTFTVLLDSDNILWEKYQQRSIPVTYLFDAYGEERNIKIGAFTSESEIEQYIDSARE